MDFVLALVLGTVLALVLGTVLNTVFETGSNSSFESMLEAVFKAKGFLGDRDVRGYELNELTLRSRLLKGDNLIEYEGGHGANVIVAQLLLTSFY